MVRSSSWLILLLMVVVEGSFRSLASLSSSSFSSAAIGTSASGTAFRNVAGRTGTTRAISAAGEGLGGVRKKGRPRIFAFVQKQQQQQRRKRSLSSLQATTARSMKAAAIEGGSTRRRGTILTMSMSSKSAAEKVEEGGDQQQGEQRGGVPDVSSRIRRTLNPCVVLMKEMMGRYASEWDDRGGIYSLAQGVVYWDPPPSATESMVRALEEGGGGGSSALHTYCPDEGLIELRRALEDKVRDENNLSNHRVMVTAGANQAYANCALTLLDENDSAVVFRPYYFNHVMALQMSLPATTTTTGSGDDDDNNNNNILIGPSSPSGVPDMDWLRSALESNPSVKMVTIANPGNPTGTNLSRATLQKAVDLCRRHGAWLVLDCTYEYFVVPNDDENDDGDDGLSPVFDGCFDDPHVIHIFSFSKSYAMAGYRCGYVAVSNDAKTSSPHRSDLYEQMLKVQDTIPICPSRISQVAALGALKAGKSWVRTKYDTLSPGRDAILNAMEPLEQIMGGSGAMYVMGKLPPRKNDDDGGVAADDEEYARKLVQKYGVAVIPGSYCGFPGWIRVCYANLPPGDCLLAASRLREGIRSLSGGGDGDDGDNR